MSKAIANEAIRTGAANPMRKGSGINNKAILITNPIRQIPRKSPFQFDPSLPSTGPPRHDPARESPAAELSEDRKVGPVSPHGAVGQRVAAGGRVAGSSVAGGQDKLLAGGLAEGGVVAVVEAEDVVVGDGEGGVG